MELVIASENVHKIREFRAILKKIPSIDLLSLHEFPKFKLPPETGKSFEENAIVKAVSAAESVGKYALADDSGLVVPALGGAPGVYSARYAGPGATDKENRQKLLIEMSLLDGTQRQAYFECAIALASPKGLIKCVKGTCEGVILSSEKGKGGFGYDSLFVKHDYGKTFAELNEETKNLISHRRKALDKILLVLETLLDSHALPDRRL